MSGNHLFIRKIAHNATTLLQVTSQTKLTLNLTLTLNLNANPNPTNP